MKNFKKKFFKLTSLFFVLAIVSTATVGCTNKESEVQTKNKDHTESSMSIDDSSKDNNLKASNKKRDNESNKKNNQANLNQSIKNNNSNTNAAINNSNSNNHKDSNVKVATENSQNAKHKQSIPPQKSNGKRAIYGTFDYSRDVPKFTNKASIVVNNNNPFFAKPTSTKVYKNYHNLDSLNRVGVCEVVTGPEFLPKAKRGDISHVKPTGWKQKKYDFIDGKFLYNRCHLIGHQIAGDDANWKNLMTGTRYMNVDGMLPYENEVTEYIKRTRHHVKYRVSPIFIGNDKVARGVLMEAQSIEDNRVKFNVFCYNVQPRVSIDYSTGYSKLAN